MKPVNRQTFNEIYQIWVFERPNQLAAAIAYYAMFDLAPVIYIALTIAGIFIDKLALTDQAVARLEALLGPELTAAVQNLMAVDAINLPEPIESYTLLSSLIGFLVLLWAASGLFTQIHFALNALWRVPPTRKDRSRKLLRQRLLSVLLVIVLGLSFVLVSILNVLITWVGSLFNIPVNYTLIAPLMFFGLAMLCFALIYKYIPDVQLRWRHAWLGAGVAAALETVGILLIGFLFQFGAFSSAAAAAGSFTLMLVIMYYMAQIFILGGVITRVLTEQGGSPSSAAGNQ